MKIVSVQEMIRREQAAIEAGAAADDLMERAAKGMEAAILRAFPMATEAAIFAGKGNNGGDGIVLARLLADDGWEVTLHLTAAREALGVLPLAKLDALERNHPEVEVRGPGDSPHWPAGDGILVDALLGVGAQGRLRGELAEVVAAMNAWRRRSFCRTVALDVPTGLLGIADEPDAESDAAVEADLTLTVGWVKEPLVRETLSGWVGRVEAIELFDNPPETGDELLFPPDLAPLLPRRSAHSHKNTFGRALIIGGSEGFLGAPVMASHAALRLGAGLVNVAVPPELVAAAAGQVMPEAMVAGRRLDDDFAELMAGCAAVALGPGLGRSEEAVATVRWVLENCEKPLVIDADGLNIVAEHLDWLDAAAAPIVLTPHPGEMKRLRGGEAFGDGDRPGVARAFVDAHKVALVLKGTRTVVAAAGQPLAFNGTGNAGLATGGSGDTLTGMLVALLAQGLAPYNAARLGVWLHGHAADLVLQHLGTEEALLPSDLAEALGPALADLRHLATELTAL